MSTSNQNNHEDPHVPSAHFRAALEQEVVQMYRRQAQFEAPPSMAKRSRWRTAATLVLGLTIGVGGAVATAQVQNNTVRDSLVAAAEARRNIDALTVQMREASYVAAKAAIRSGARPPEDELKESVSVTIAQMELKRSDYDIQEIKESGKPVRDELWAPLVNGHDYVSYRLRLDAFIHNQLIARADKDFQRDRLANGPGMTEADSILLRQQVISFELSRQLIAQRLSLRQDFLNGKYNEKVLPGLLEMAALQNDIMRNVLAQKASMLRLEKLRKLLQDGSASELDYKRAEVSSLELRLQLEELNKAMKLLQTQNATVLRKKN